MKTTITKLITTIVIAAFAATMTVQAAEKKKEAAKEASAEKKPGAIPFHGKIGAVDKNAKTITLEGKEKTRTFHVTSQTVIVKAGQPATLDDAKTGEEVGGSYIKTADDKMEVRKLRIGPKPETEKKTEGEAKKKKDA